MLRTSAVFAVLIVALLARTTTAAEPLCSEPDETCGRTLLKAHQFDGARGVLQGCVAKQPTNFECHKLLGSALARLDEADESIKHYQQFISLAPKSHRDVPRVIALLDAAQALVPKQRDE